jgi:hypothetical protein
VQKVLLKMSDVLTTLSQHDGNLIIKWSNYLQIYEHHFSRFKGRSVTVLEIGVYHGGSLELWRTYFGGQSKVVGIDINPNSKRHESPNICIEIGDQGNVDFLQGVLTKHGPFDIIIDDGSHASPHQIMSLEMGWNSLRSDGIYLCEDTHSSYQPFYSGGLKLAGTFIEHCKNVIDELHGFHSCNPGEEKQSRFTSELNSLTFYDSVVVLQKRPPRGPAQLIATGLPVPEYPDNLLEDYVGYRENFNALLEQAASFNPND